MSNFTFLYPLWLIAAIPWAVLMLWLIKRNRNQTLIAPHLAKAMGIQGKVSNKGGLKLASLAGLLAIIALSGPSFISQERPSFANTSARVIVMDMSMSMYATDIKPNRLTQARYKVTDLLAQWKDGSTGLVAYAGDAYIVSPMTSDTNTIANLVPNLSPELMPYPGADAAKGVQLAIEMMQNTGLATGDIVLVADDIDDAERSNIDSLLSGTNWRLTILGVGSRSGAPIKLSDGTLMTLSSGQPVVAKSNFNNMKSLASRVNGQFVPIQLTSSDVENIAQLTSHVDEASNKSNTSQIAEAVNQGFWLLPLLLIPALALFRRGVLFSFVVIALPLLQPKPAMASPWKTDEQQAMELYKNKEYQQAAELFSDPNWKGVAQYQAGDYQGAIESLKNDKSESGQYNLANALAQAGELEQAAELYSSILKKNPDNSDAKANLEVVKKALEQQQQQQQQQGDSDSSNTQEQQGQDSTQQPSGSEQEQPSEQESSQSDSAQPDTPEPNKNGEGEMQKSGNDEQQENPAESQSRDKQEPKENANDASQPQQAEANPSDEDEKSDSDAAPMAVSQDNQQQIDPELRKLEQVESARDPSRLIRAQILLQAQQKQAPQQTGKQW